MREITSKNKYLPSAMAYQIAMESARIWQIFAFCLFGMLVLTFILILVLLPLKEKEVRLLRVGGAGDTFVEIYPANIPQDQKELLVKRELMGFVHDAHEVDNITENNRYKRLYAMSNGKVYHSLVSNAKEVMKLLKDGSREVEIIYARKRDNNIMEVEFATRDKTNHSEDQKKWEAIIKYRLLDKPIKGINVLLNPLNIIVEKYHVQEKSGDLENKVL